MEAWTCPCGAANAPEDRACRQCGLAAGATLRLTHPGSPPMPGQPPARLLGLSPGMTGSGVPVGQAEPVTLGRAPGNQLVVEGDPSVSAVHARIYYAPPHYAVEDLGSTNGTFVNGQRITGSVPIVNGDTIQVGQARFQFLLDSLQPALYASPPTYPGHGPAYPPAHMTYAAPKDRVAAGVLAILLGGLGIHLFYLNKVGWGIAFLLFTILTCGYGSLLTGPIAIVQGILYLCATEQDFHQKYVVEQRFF